MLALAYDWGVHLGTVYLRQCVVSDRTWRGPVLLLLVDPFRELVLSLLGLQRLEVLLRERVVDSVEQGLRVMLVGWLSLWGFV